MIDHKAIPRGSSTTRDGFRFYGGFV